MSMISSQIDRLRHCADLYDGTTKPEMAKELQRPILAQELRKAADTIWQMRDDLQRANAAVQDAEHDESMAWDRVRKAEAENAKLRERIHELEMEGSDHFYRTAYAEDANRTLERENAKLWELVRDMYKFMSIAEKLNAHIKLAPSETHSFANRMRELGVEVD